MSISGGAGGGTGGNIVMRPGAGTTDGDVLIQDALGTNRLQVCATIAPTVRSQANACVCYSLLRMAVYPSLPLALLPSRPDLAR